jgi:hypothetical protein
MHWSLLNACTPSKAEIIVARSKVHINWILPRHMIGWTGAIWRGFYDDWGFIANGYIG